MLDEDIIIPANLKINPYTYLDLKFKFELYIKIIELFGGYIFQEHLYKFSNKSKRQFKYDVKAMKKGNILKVINVNNNSYVMLTTPSLRYLKNRSNVSSIRSPSFTQLKTCAYLGEYVENLKDFFSLKKPYIWFLKEYKTELEKYKSADPTTDINFLTCFKEKVKLIKHEEIKSRSGKDIFSTLKSSRIYFDSVENKIATFIMLDFDRSKIWIYKTLLKKVEPIIEEIGIFKGYNIKILTCSRFREESLISDIKNINHNGLIFLRNIEIINLDVNKYFQSNKQRESFLKEIDKLEISKFKSTLKSKM